MFFKKTKLANSKNRNRLLNRNAFTLIELLAIIVILAIIAVITVPIILNIIDNSKRGAAIDSAYGYRDAIYKGFLTDLSLDPSKELPNGIYVIDNTGKLVNSNGVILTVNVSGTEPDDGWVELDKGEVVAFSLKFGDYVVTKYQDTEATAEKNGEIAENVEAREARLESERQTSAKNKAKTLATSQTGTTEIINITDGWVAFINGELKAYSIKVTEGEYTYVVTDMDVNTNNSNAVADRTTSDLASKTSAEQVIINYYSSEVATEVSNYISSLLADSTIQGYTKDTGKKVSEISTPTAPTGTDTNSWIYFKKESSSVSAPDYSIKMTKGDYSFVVNSVDGTVSSPVYNGELENQKKPVSFADDSWADIKANLTSNRNFYPIGSEKIIEMDRDNNGTNEYYKLRLVNTEPCNGYTGSNTSCGVVIEFVTTIGTHNMNSSNTNAGGWKESEMRTYLNSDVLELLPNDLKSVIIGTAPIVSGSGRGSVSDDVVAPGDKLYLLSGKEVGLIKAEDNKKEDTDTKTLKYYTENTGDGPRIKYSTTTQAGQDSSKSDYWLRSASSYYTNIFCYVRSGGSDSGSYANSTFGVAPAFRILD